MIIQRKMEGLIRHHLKRGKSILLLGPRQTGKSTLIEGMSADLAITFSLPSNRQRYEKSPEILKEEVESLHRENHKRSLLVTLDEVQKVPAILDVVQFLIDRKMARFILTGSSARKIKRGSDANLLPGRVVSLGMSPFLYDEYSQLSIERILDDGMLPAIATQSNSSDRAVDLKSYVESYLEDEIRAEAIVRRLGHFARFLELACLESGRISNFSSLSQEIGISHTTIAAFYEVLEDTLIAHRVDPITRSTSRKKLTRSSRYLIFDMGVRRVCAGEAPAVGSKRHGELFEQWIGLELINRMQYLNKPTRLRFWRDPDGPEVDWVIDQGSRLVPLEVKWTDHPQAKHVKHLHVFMEEYGQKAGYIVCTAPRPIRISKNVTAISWRDLQQTLSD